MCDSAGLDPPADLTAKLELWQEMAEAVGDGLLCFSPDLICQYASPRAAVLLLHPPIPLRGNSLQTILPESSPLLPLFQRNDAAPASVELRVAQAGEERWLSLRLLSTEPWFILHLRDTTRERQEKDVLWQEQTWFDSAIAQLETGFILGNQFRKVVRINEKLQAMFQLPLSLNEYIGGDCETVAEHAGAVFEDSVGFQQRVRTILGQRQPLYGQNLLTTCGKHYEFDFIPIRAGENDIGHLWLFRDRTDLDLAQTTLEASEERFRAIAEASPQGIYVEDRSSNCLYVNPAYEKLTGYSFAEIQGNQWQQLIYPEDLKRLVELWQQKRPALETTPGLVLEYQYRLLRADGECRWCHARTRAMRDGAGNLLGFIGAVEDITDRLQAEKNLWQSREQFRAISDASPLGVFVEDSQGKAVYLNPAYERIAGYPASEMLGEGWKKRIPAEDLEHLNRIWEPFRRQLRADSASIFDFPHRTILPDGTVRRCHARIAPMWDAEGTLTGYVGTLEDVTERFEAVQALKESEARYRALVEATADIVWRLDAGLQLLEVQGVIAEIEAEPLIRTLQTFLSTEVYRQGEGSAPLPLALEQGSWHLEQEFMLKTAQGTWRDLMARAVPIFSAEGEIQEWVGTISDISVIKQAEAERERLMQEALHRAAHDSLTDVLNHRAFREELLLAERRFQQEATPFAILVLDVDNFKYFNQAYGHLTGDAVLLTVTRILAEECQAADRIGRLGGDEFAVLISRNTTAEVEETVLRLRERVQSEKFQPDEDSYPVPLRLSLGSAIVPLETQTAEQAFSLADRRALLDKQGGHYTPARNITEYLRETVEGFVMLDALITAVDNKDRYTRRHSEEVLIYSLLMGKALQLSEEELEILKAGALVHDVGKIGVPDHILRLPGKLSFQDYEVMKRHVQLGALLVQAVPGMEATVDIVRYHHERWDGTGYPEGLAGHRIPLLARLLAVADAFSAMTTDRPYRKGRSAEESLAALRRGGGIQWDPEMVRALEQGLRQASYAISAACLPDFELDRSEH